MNTSQSIRRSIYASKLSAFSDFVFDDNAAFQHRGDWQAFFTKRIGPAFDGKIIFDVGCADAGHLARIATKYPTAAFVGLDWKYKAVFDGAGRVASEGLKNVILLRGRAQDIRKVFADNEVDEIWVFYPEPCDRDIELRNRLIAEPFLVDVHHVLRDRISRLCLKTDHRGYYQWVLGLFGLPEPAWFSIESDASVIPPGTLRLRRRDLMRRDLIPELSKAIRERFIVRMNSPDLWNDPIALRHIAPRVFSGETTLFEERFLRKRLPIYYFEIAKT